MMRKPNAAAARIAAKRQLAAGRRKKVAGGVSRIEAMGSFEYLAAAWLATKPRSERWGLLERYPTGRDLMNAIFEDTASHAEMARIIECDPRVFPGQS